MSDDPDAPAKWTFPDRVLNPGAYLVVFASGKDRRAPTGANRYHTNFRLNAFGEFLALFNAEYPRVAVSVFDPYPEQRINYSYGLDATNAWRYFATYTPGGANASSALTGMAPPPHVTIGRGMFDQPFDVRLTTPLAGASIRYTMDGNDPALGGGEDYSGPIRIASTTTLRAAVLAPGLLPSRTRTETYVFLDQVLVEGSVLDNGTLDGNLRSLGMRAQVEIGESLGVSGAQDRWG